MALWSKQVKWIKSFENVLRRLGHHCIIIMGSPSRTHTRCVFGKEANMRVTYLYISINGIYIYIYRMGNDKCMLLMGDLLSIYIQPNELYTTLSSRDCAFAFARFTRSWIVVKKFPIFNPNEKKNCLRQISQEHLYSSRYGQSAMPTRKIYKEEECVFAFTSAENVCVFLKKKKRRPKIQHTWATSGNCTQCAVPQLGTKKMALCGRCWCIIQAYFRQGVCYVFCAPKLSILVLYTCVCQKQVSLCSAPQQNVLFAPRRRCRRQGIRRRIRIRTSPYEFSTSLTRRKYIWTIWCVCAFLFYRNASKLHLSQFNTCAPWRAQTSQKPFGWRAIAIHIAHIPCVLDGFSNFWAHHTLCAARVAAWVGSRRMKSNCLTCFLRVMEMKRKYTNAQTTSFKPPTRRDSIRTFHTRMCEHVWTQIMIFKL